MTNAQIVTAWQDATSAHIAVRVAEAKGNVEYIGSVPLADLEGLTPGQQKAKLVQAVKAIRDQQVNARKDMPGIVGNVTV